MNACPPLLQTPCFPKGLHGAQDRTATDPGAVPSTGSLPSVLETIACLQKPGDGLIKTKHKKTYYPSFAMLARSLHSPVQVLLTWL